LRVKRFTCGLSYFSLTSSDIFLGALTFTPFQLPSSPGASSARSRQTVCSSRTSRPQSTGRFKPPHIRRERAVFARVGGDFVERQPHSFLPGCVQAWRAAGAGAFAFHVPNGVAARAAVRWCHARRRAIPHHVLDRHNRVEPQHCHDATNSSPKSVWEARKLRTKNARSGDHTTNRWRCPLLQPSVHGSSNSALVAAGREGGRRFVPGNGPPTVAISSAASICACW
jgi:hypothetical protein